MNDNQATATPTQKDSSNSDAQYSNNPQTQSNKRQRVSSSTSTDDINQNEMQEIIKRTLNVALKTFENEMRNYLDAKLLEQAERIEKLE